MIKYQKRIAQYVTVVSLGPIGSILEKHFMLKKSVPMYEYILTICACLLAFFCWYLFLREKKNCQNILIKELNDRYVVTILKSRWDDLIVKIKIKNVTLNISICKIVYNPQYISEDKYKQIKWNNKLGMKFVIVDEKISKEVYGKNYSSFLFDMNNKKFRFFYGI